GRPLTWAPCSTTCAATVRRSPACSDPEPPALSPVRRHLLVVDDEPHIGLLLRPHFERLGYVVSLARTLAEARRTLQGGDPPPSPPRPLPRFLRTRDECLGRRLGRRGGDPILAALDTRAAQATTPARRRPPPPGPGGGAARRTGPARADPDPHRAVPGRSGGARGAADPARADLCRAARGVHRTGAHLGRALDFATGPRGPDAVAARRLGGER